MDHELDDEGVLDEDSGRGEGPIVLLLALKP